MRGCPSAMCRYGPVIVALLVMVFVATGATPAIADPVATTQDTVEPGGLLGPFTNTDTDGVPLNHYDITADPGGWTDWDHKLLMVMTDAAFTLARTIVGGSVWLLNWAFTFAPAEMIIEPARQVAQTFQTEVIDRLGLPGVLLVFGAAWCGVQILRGRVARGAGELAITLLISALAATVLARPADLLLGDDGLLGQTRDTAMALTAITLTQGESASTDPEQAAQPLNDALVRTFVVQPHQALNYGRILDEDHPCRSVYATIVADGPWGSEAEPRDRLTDEGGVCEELAEYNAEPSMDRLLGAYLLVGAAAVVCLLIVLLVCVLLIAVIAMGVYVILCPAALVAALLPGGGRQLLWRWISGVVKTVLSIIAICVFLAVFALLVQALMDASGGLPLVGRFALLNIVALGGLAYHRKLLTAGARASQLLSRNLEAARLGGTRGRGWMGPTGAASQGLSPISVTGLARGARTEINRVAAPIRRTSRTLNKTWAGNPTDRRKALSGLPAGASGLRRKLAQTRGGRVMLGAGKAAALTTKIAFGSTIGAPIAIPKAAAVVKRATRVRSAATKAKLVSAAATTATTTKRLTDAWSKVPPVSTVRTATARALAADADATRTRDLLTQRSPAPRTAPPTPAVPQPPPTSSAGYGTVTVHPSTPPPDPPASGTDAAAKLREQIQQRRRPRRPGGR